MLASSRLACFWPGLASAWHRGNTSGLAIAIISAWTLSLLLLATFVWPQWVSVLAIRGLWSIAALGWVIAFIRSQWLFSRLMLVSKPLEAKDDFLKAQVDYLAGNWFEAEAKLLQILHDFPRDAESQLLLIGVLRHTRRYRPALRRLTHLESLDSAVRWRYELGRERVIIESRLAADRKQESEREGNPEQESMVNCASQDGSSASETSDVPSVSSVKGSLAGDIHHPR